MRACGFVWIHNGYFTPNVIKKATLTMDSALIQVVPHHNHLENYYHLGNDDYMVPFFYSMYHTVAQTTETEMSF